MHVEDAFESGDAACVERDARFAAQQLERLVTRPGRAIPPGRDERVVDVANAEDARREIEVVAADAAWIPRAVEPLVVVEHEAPDAVVEAAELREQLAAAFGMHLHDRVLEVVERPGLPE